MDLALISSIQGNDIYMWLTFGVIIAAMVSYALEKLPLEITSLAILVALLLIFHIPQLIDAPNAPDISPTDILAGFGNPALIAVIALLVMGQGLFRSGAIEGATERFASLAGKSPRLALSLIMLMAMLASAFLNNTPVVLMCIPILAAVAGKVGLAPPRVMMSLSFICILGGMTTLIGSSTNLLLAGSVAADPNNSMGEIGFFDFTVPGMMLAAIGAIYVLFIMPLLLRGIEKAEDDDKTDQSGKQYIVEVRLRSDDSLVGAQPVAGFFTELTGMTLRMVERSGETFLPPFENLTLQAGDTLVMAATRRQLTDALSNADHPLASFARSAPQSADISGDAATPTLAEVVIAPGSRMQARTIYQTGFHFETGCQVLGVQRRSRMLRQNLRDIRLEAGDVLLVLGMSQQIQALRSNRNVLLLEWSAANLPDFTHANKARVIFILTVLAAAFNIVPIVTAATAGAAAMILSGALNIRQAVRSIDGRIILTIAAALGMATALTQTGGSRYFVMQFLTLFENAPAWAVLSAFFLLCAVTTNILSNNATAVLFAPIALELSGRLGVAAEPFVFAVIFAANCSFATPIAYQTNLLVMSPGNYQFRDFIRAGLPLIILLWISYTILAPWYFNFS